MTPAAVPSRAAVRQMWQRRSGRLGVLALFFALPVLPVAGPRIQEFAFPIGWALTFAMVGLSMNVLVGYAGQISLAQAVLFGSGAFALGNLVTVQGVPWLVSLPLAGLATAAIAMIIGFPALRIRGLNLAIATLGFQFAMNRVIFRIPALSAGAAGIDVERPLLFGVDFNDDRNFLYLIMAILVIIMFIDRNLARSRGGRAFYAIRQDEQVASSFGIPVARYKLLAFAISGFYAGIAGALFGTLQQDVTNELFDYLISFQFLVFAVLGGLGSRLGTAVGSAFPVIFTQLVQGLALAGPMLGGLLLVLTLLRYPGGIAAQGREFSHVFGLLLRRKWYWAFPFIGALAVSWGIAAPAGIWAAKGLTWFFDRVMQARDLGNVVAIVLALGIATVLFEILGRIVVRASGALSAAAAHHVADVTPLTISTNGRVSFRRTAKATRASTAPLLEVFDLAMHFGGVRALDGVSLEVREGELIGIMGPNGSGKTTLLNCISGFLTPTTGDIRFRGRSMAKMPPHARASLGLGRTFQNVGLVKSETVFDNFMIAQHQVCRYGPLEGMVRTGGVVSEETRLRMRANAAIDLLGLRDVTGEQVRALPHGRAKLVELGCALVTGPEILLLDEPAAGVSPQEADALGDSLKKIASDFGVTILMIEHHVPLMLSTCDYIYVLNFGQLLTHGEPADVARHPDVIAAYLGTAGREVSLAASGGH